MYDIPVDNLSNGFVSEQSIRADVKLPDSVSQVVVSPLKEPKNNVVALASVTVADKITINSVTVRQKSVGSGFYVKMPQKRTVDGNYVDVVHPLDGETRKALNTAITNMFTSGKFKAVNQTYGKDGKSEVKARNCAKYKPSDNSPVLARADIIVDDFVVHNAKIFRTKDGGKSLNMPSYIDKNGEYHSIVVPKNSDSFNEMNDAAIKEFNTDYKYLEAASVDIEALKAAKIDFQSVKSESGTLLKFRAADEAAVNNIVNPTPATPKLP